MKCISRVITRVTLYSLLQWYLTQARVEFNSKLITQMMESVSRRTTQVTFECCSSVIAQVTLESISKIITQKSFEFSRVVTQETLESNSRVITDVTLTVHFEGYYNGDFIVYFKINYPG